MGKMQDFDQSLRDAGIPIDGVSGNGPNCRIDFAATATPQQKQAARDARTTFDWTEKVALGHKELYQRILALDDITRTNLLCRIAAQLALQFDLKEAYGEFDALVPVVVPIPAPVKPS